MLLAALGRIHLAHQDRRNHGVSGGMRPNRLSRLFEKSCVHAQYLRALGSELVAQGVRQRPHGGLRCAVGAAATEPG